MVGVRKLSTKVKVGIYVSCKKGKVSYFQTAHVWNLYLIVKGQTEMVRWSYLSVVKLIFYFHCLHKCWPQQ